MHTYVASGTPGKAPAGFKIVESGTTLMITHFFRYIHQMLLSGVDVCILLLYSVSKKNPPPEVYWHFFPNGWEFVVQILHAYYTFQSTLDYKFLFNYLQL